MPARSRVLSLGALLGALSLAGCARLPSNDNISQGQLLLELSDALGELRGQDAMLQEQIDSLRVVVARQDSLLARLANATGVPLTP